ncbi:MAG: hypothetical protein KBD00_01410 [Candidatus Peribacteraceae bacterium]|nr:hypothetical protein [Candidatus Peribacteraceae bacterium]
MPTRGLDVSYVPPDRLDELELKPRLDAGSGKLTKAQMLEEAEHPNVQGAYSRAELLLNAMEARKKQIAQTIE